MDGKRLTVRRSRVQVGYETLEQDTKTGRSRVIALDEGTVEALRRQAELQRADQDEWLGAWQGDGHVFAREDGKPWHPDRITKLFEQALQAAGLPRDPPARPASHARDTSPSSGHPSESGQRATRPRPGVDDSRYLLPCDPSSPGERGCAHCSTRRRHLKRRSTNGVHKVPASGVGLSRRAPLAGTL